MPVPDTGIHSPSRRVVGAHLATLACNPLQPARSPPSTSTETGRNFVPRQVMERAALLPERCRGFYAEPRSRAELPAAVGDARMPGS